MYHQNFGFLIRTLKSKISIVNHEITNQNVIYLRVKNDQLY